MDPHLTSFLRWHAELTAEVDPRIDEVTGSLITRLERLGGSALDRHPLWEADGTMSAAPIVRLPAGQWMLAVGSATDRRDIFTTIRASHPALFEVIDEIVLLEQRAPGVLRQFCRASRELEDKLVRFCVALAVQMSGPADDSRNPLAYPALLRRAAGRRVYNCLPPETRESTLRMLSLVMARVTYGAVTVAVETPVLTAANIARMDTGVPGDLSVPGIPPYARYDLRPWFPRLVGPSARVDSCSFGVVNTADGWEYLRIGLLRGVALKGLRKAS